MVNVTGFNLNSKAHGLKLQIPDIFCKSLRVDGYFQAHNFHQLLKGVQWDTFYHLGHTGLDNGSIVATSRLFQIAWTLIFSR